MQTNSIKLVIFVIQIVKNAYFLQHIVRFAIQIMAITTMFAIFPVLLDITMTPLQVLVIALFAVLFALIVSDLWISVHNVKLLHHIPHFYTILPT